MTIKIGTVYIHTVLGHQDAQGAIVITEDTGLATMTGRYVDNLPTASTDPDAYTWTELADPEEVDDTEDDTTEGAEDTTSMLYRMAGTQMTEAIQDNLAVGTNQGASGWETATGTIAAAPCQPDGSAEAVNGVAWTATAGGTLLRTEHIPGEAVPETVTVSFWWLASAACGLTVSIGNNESETQYNHDSTDLDEDGNALDLTDAWLFFRALIPIAQTADDYAVKVATDSAATISIGNFKVEPGDKVTAWTESAKAAMSAAQTADSKAQAAEGKATTADEKAQAAGTTAQEAQEVLTGLTVVDANGVTKINGGRIDTDSLFAQNITATGTITGAQLIGAILRGGAINIKGSFEGYTGTEEGYLKTESNGSGTPRLTLGMGSASITLEPNGMSDVVIDGSDIYIGAPGEASSTTVHDLYITGEASADAKYNTYDSFSGSVLSDGGRITVTKKLGVCYISGSLEPLKNIADWTTILDSSKVPAPQHGVAVPFNAAPWGNSYVAALHFKVLPEGGLQIRAGSARGYVFAIAYPID